MRSPEKEIALKARLFYTFSLRVKVAFRGLGFAEGVRCKRAERPSPPAGCKGKSIPHTSRPLHSRSHASRGARLLTRPGLWDHEALINPSSKFPTEHDLRRRGDIKDI